MRRGRATKSGTARWPRSSPPSAFRTRRFFRRSWPSRDRTARSRGSTPRWPSNVEAVHAGRADHLHRDHFNTLLPRQFSDLCDRHRGHDVGPERPDADAAATRSRCRRAFAAHVRSERRSRAASTFAVQEFDVDHATMVPLHFLTPHMKIPIVPIFINGLAPPLPGAKRCYALGETVRAAIEDWPQNDARRGASAAAASRSRSAGRKSPMANAPARPIRNGPRMCRT